MQKPGEEKFFFAKLVDYMTSGPVVIMELEGVNAVKVWDKLKGPTDLKKVNKDRRLCMLGFPARLAFELMGIETVKGSTAVLAFFVWHGPDAERFSWE